MGPQFKHVPLGPETRSARRRFPYTALVFVAYALLTPLAAAGAALLFKAAGLGDLLVRTQAPQPLPRAPSWQNLLFGAGAPELALAGGLMGLLLWRQLWRGDDPVLGADVVRGMLLGALYGLLVIPVGIFGLYLRTAPAGVPLVVQPFFALLVSLAGSVYAVILPWVWGAALALGAVLGLISALAAVALKARLPA